MTRPDPASGTASPTDAPTAAGAPLPASAAVSRRVWLERATLSLVGLAVTPFALRAQHGNLPPIPRAMTVYKSPTCGCCTGWVEHVQKAGFTVTVRDLPDLSEVKAAYGIPATLQSCHTATIGGYLVEGHVPADLVVRLLTEKPSARGLAVPGMPVGSPGMEGGTPERYDILLFTKAGGTRVFASR